MPSLLVPDLSDGLGFEELSSENPQLAADGGRGVAKGSPSLCHHARVLGHGQRECQSEDDVEWGISM